MIHKKKHEKANSIPVDFADEEPEVQVEPKGLGDEAVGHDSHASSTGADPNNSDIEDPQGSTGDSVVEENEPGITDHVELEDEPPAVVQVAESSEGDGDVSADDPSSGDEEESASIQGNKTAAGPMLAELIATRAELRRVETERNDLLERLARRQADFENFRKRVERERGETYQRMVGDVVSKLLPVMDNMRRALQAESILEKDESAEFRHFLRGVELIYKQLNDALQELGVEPVPAVGQPFDPHVHEAVATEHSDEYEPDTVTQELLRGYRLGEKLLRPAMVKVSTRQ